MIRWVTTPSQVHQAPTTPPLPLPQVGATQVLACLPPVGLSSLSLSPTPFSFTLYACTHCTPFLLPSPCHLPFPSPFPFPSHLAWPFPSFGLCICLPLPFPHFAAHERLLEQTHFGGQMPAGTVLFSFAHFAHTHLPLPPLLSSSPLCTATCPSNNCHHCLVFPCYLVVPSSFDCLLPASPLILSQDREQEYGRFSSLICLSACLTCPCLGVPAGNR